MAVLRVLCWALIFILELIRSKRNITGHDVSGLLSYMQVTQHTSKKTSVAIVHVNP